jgi:hypothetical protein
MPHIFKISDNSSQTLTSQRPIFSLPYKKVTALVACWPDALSERRSFAGNVEKCKAIVVDTISDLG